MTFNNGPKDLHYSVHVDGFQDVFGSGARCDQLEQ